MEKTAVQRLIQDIDKAIEDCDERRELCFMGRNREKYDNMKDGLYFARGAAEKLLQTERQQIIEAYEDPTCQTFTGEQYYNQKYKE